MKTEDQPARDTIVVVESPAKAKTIAKYLGSGYRVLASYGHVRAFPKRDGSVEPDRDFALHYKILPDKEKRVEAIAKAMRKARELILASDLDREGEAIAWHIVEILREKGLLDGKQVKRITFHEITKRAILEALKHPRDIDHHLVAAQQARSALDYLVGFTLSPLLWRKVRSGLSAGRVQSVALRLICERETSIRNFKPKEYWTVEARCRADSGTFNASLVELGGKKLGKYDLPNQEEAAKAADFVRKARLSVANVQNKRVKQQPPPPFITSTLQMEAARKLGFTARKTMQLAQRLYEGEEINGERIGLITYMRTDAVNLAKEAVEVIRAHIQHHFGEDYLPARARVFKKKTKNAQEAHEAIRPTDISLTPDKLRGKIPDDEWRLYRLIWLRTIACQMRAAEIDQVRVDLTDGHVTLRASGSSIVFPGFRVLYTESSDEEGKEATACRLPRLKEGDSVIIEKVETKQHFTEPKPRFTEASLVKELEKHGIGRPSTYATILAVLRERGYVRMERKRFVPTDIGEVVNRFLCTYFPEIVDVGFTAEMEDKLDAIARGEVEWKPVLRRFWGPFKEKVDQTLQNVSRADVLHEKTDERCPQCGKPLAIKLGKYGRFLACTAFPECRFSKPLDDSGKQGETAEETDQVCAKCGAPMQVKTGRYGRFLGCSRYPECRFIQPIEAPKDTQVPCPACGEGTFLEKKTRRGKVFYSCSSYPKCKNALWDKPVALACPKCGAPFVVEKTGKKVHQLRCIADGCDWQKATEPSARAA